MTEKAQGPGEWTGREILDANARPIGVITGLAHPRRRFGTSWLTVETPSDLKLPVPLIGIRSVGDRLVLPYPKSYVESGPTIAQEQRLTRSEWRRLGLQYGFDIEPPGKSCCRTCGLCSTAKRTHRP